jgi:hypothetical protein
VLNDSRLFYLSGLNRGRGGADYVEHEVGLGEHWDMATLDLIGGGAHPFGNETFQIGVHSAVVLAHDVPARLRLPRRSFKLLVEKVRVWHGVESLAIFPKASAGEKGSIGRFKMTLVESLQG